MVVTGSKKSTCLYLFILLSLLITACERSTPTPEKVIETVVVEREGETIYETVEVIVTPEPRDVKPLGVEERIIAADGLVPCLPLPEIPQAISVQGIGLIVHTDRPQVLLAPKAHLHQDSGKVYRIGTIVDVVSTNFWASTGIVASSIMLPQRLSLLTYAPKVLTLIPQVAKDFPAPLVKEGDFWVVEIPIREDIKWSDGTSLTAEDYVFTVDTILKLGLVTGGLGSYVDTKFLDHVEALDDYTIKIYYHTKPGYMRHDYSALTAPILSKAYWDPVVSEAMAPIEALGEIPSQEELAAAKSEAQDILFAHIPEGEPFAGGFSIKKWEPGAYLELEANPYYFERGKTIQLWANGAYKDSEGLEVGVPEGDVETVITVGPHVESIVYKIYGSRDTAILGLKNGDVDFIIGSGGLQRGQENQLRNDPNLTVVENPTFVMRYLSFNNRRRPMNDCAFRQAVAVLIDKEFIANEILQGAVQPLYHYVPTANTPWYSDQIPKLGQGLSREQRTLLAKAILKQAGYTWEEGIEPAWNPDGSSVVPGGHLLMPDGTPVPALNLLSPGPGYDPLRSIFAIWIENWLNEFGIPLQAELAGFNELLPRIFIDQNFDMFILGWSLWEIPDYLYDFFTEENAVSDGDNAGGYINPEYDALAGQLLTCETYQVCKEISDQAQFMLATEMPYVLLFTSSVIDAYRSDSVVYPYTEVLDGLTGAHAGGTMQNLVIVK